MCCCLFVLFYLLLLSFAGEQFDKSFLERRKSFLIFFLFWHARLRVLLLLDKLKRYGCSLVLQVMNVYLK